MWELVVIYGKEGYERILGGWGRGGGKRKDQAVDQKEERKKTDDKV